MKNYLTAYAVFLIPLIFISACSSGNSVKKTAVNGNSGETKFEASSQGEVIVQKTPYDYKIVLKAQKSLVKKFSWPAKHELDLNDDGTAEIFLAIEGYSRGMDYALFRNVNKTWVLLSGGESIASGHLGIRKSESSNMGWHDFVALQPSGRDGMIESYYYWNGTRYILKEQKEVPNKEHE